MKPWALVRYEDESIYTVTAIKLFEGSLLECRRKIETKNENEYGIVGNFDGDEVNAMYVQQIYPEPLYHT